MPQKPTPPLSGKRIVITRPEGQNAALRTVLDARGATVLEIPLLDIEYTADPAVLDSIWTDMGCFDWLIFTSANGVHGFFDRFFETFNDIRGIGLCRIACVGDATASALRSFHLNIDLIPATATADALAKELLDTEDLAHLRVLIVTGNRNSDTLAKALETRAHAIVQTLTVYATTENNVGQLDAADSFRRQGAHAIVFASPSAVDAFIAQVKLLTPAKTAIHPKAIAIGPSTADALREHGISVAAQALSPDPAALADAVESALRTA
ncbi:MAG: uroporphyrinogen-III synthase [Puniceicoccales bacterium]|jgi:uroporphyrinogen-III synthase|nr:uroporphyrinogen-III synthase [Puniceicoccales bacterium]